ncbi:Ig-like domain-containing protein [Streptomyces sp. NPDC056716]|uniref:L,D-transpeptidase n=1 Tax=unclassified Streptomyces TaxID=2593676 RepID=UPI0036A0620C
MTAGPISGASVATRGARGARAGRGRGRLGALFAGAVLLAVTACGGGSEPDPGPGTDEGKGSGKDSTAAQSKESQAVVSIAPKDGTGSVDTSGDLEVTAAKGKLTEVVVQDGDGTKVDGTISADGTAWTPARHLAASTTYQVRATAQDTEGRAATQESSFTTLTPKNTFLGTFTPEDGSTVGVGMPFSIRFDRGITNPADVEKAIEITTEPAVDVQGHWFGDDRLDFRPETYWKAGTEVTVRLGLDGVEGRPGVYGEQAKTVSFTIGRDQVTVVDAENLTMKVMRDGKVVKTLPITTGAPGYETWNGKMVISEKLKETRMDGATVGYEGEYDIPDVPHAMRLSDSGTFIHGNYWAGDAFGNRNASHGCIGLRDVQGAWDEKAPGAWFFDNSLLGDVVEVKNSDDATIAPDNGLNGWNMSWADWTA